MQKKSHIDNDKSRDILMHYALYATQNIFPGERKAIEKYMQQIKLEALDLHNFLTLKYSPRSKIFCYIAPYSSELAQTLVDHTYIAIAICIKFYF